MAILQCSIILLLGISSNQALNILLFSSAHTKSHVMFSYRLASTLTSRGHQVLVHVGPMHDEQVARIQPPPGIRVIRQKKPTVSEEQAQTFAKNRKSFHEMAWEPPKESPLLRLFKVLLKLNYWNSAVAPSCLNDEVQLEEFRKENFDIALSHHLDLCPLAIASVIGVKKVVWAVISPFLMDFCIFTMGMPILHSTIPNAASTYTDRMDFMERVMNNALDAVFVVFSHMPSTHISAMDAAYQNVVKNQSRRVAPEARNGKSLRIVVKEQITTLFMNGEPALDYPRPILPGMMYLGQLENFAETKDLSEEWKSMVNSSRDGTIMFSFGSIANTSMMPMEMKVAFLDAFKQFPTYSIIWRLEGQMPPGIQGQRHIKVVNWLPQRELLNQGNVKLFITHGGYNSIVETVQAGVPMLLIPLFHDNEGNAKRAVRHGLGLILDKTNLDNRTITRVIRTLLTDHGFSLRASKFPKFMSDKLIPIEDAWVKQLESIARTRRWPISPARKMSLFKFTCMDVILAFLMTFVAAVYLLIKLLVLFFRLFR